MGILFTILMGFLFTITLGIQFTISTLVAGRTLLIITFMEIRLYPLCTGRMKIWFGLAIRSWLVFMEITLIAPGNGGMVGVTRVFPIVVSYTIDTIRGFVEAHMGVLETAASRSEFTEMHAHYLFHTWHRCNSFRIIRI